MIQETEPEQFARIIGLPLQVILENKKKFVRQLLLEKHNLRYLSSQESLINSTNINIKLPSSLKGSLIFPSNNKSIEHNSGLSSSEIIIPRIGAINKDIQYSQNSSQIIKIPVLKSLSYLRISCGSQLSNQSLQNQQHFSQIQQLLKNQKLFCLFYFKNFKLDNILNTQGRLQSQDPFRSCILYVFDIILSNPNYKPLQNQILFNSLKKIDINYRPYILQMIQQQIGNNQIINSKGIKDQQQQTQLQIKRLYIQYYIQKLQNPSKQLVDSVSEYSVIEVIIEIVAMNYIQYKMQQNNNNKQFELFLRQYKSQEGNEQIIFKNVGNIFELKFEKVENTYHLQSQSKILIIQVVKQQDETRSFLSYLKDK